MPTEDFNAGLCQSNESKQVNKIPLKLLFRKILTSKSKLPNKQPEIVVTPPSPIISLDYHDFIDEDLELFDTENGKRHMKTVSYILLKPKRVKVTVSRRKIREVLIPGITITPPSSSESKQDYVYEEYELLITDESEYEIEAASDRRDSSGTIPSVEELSLQGPRCLIRRSKSLSSLPNRNGTRKNKSKDISLRFGNSKFERKAVCESSLLDSLLVAVAATPSVPIDINVRAYKRL